MEKLKTLGIGLVVALLTLAVGIGAAIYKKQRSHAKKAVQTASPVVVSHASVDSELVTDDRFFSRAVAVPKGEVSDERRIDFARDLEAAIDAGKAGLKDVEFRAEAPDKDVMALYAYDVTRERCLALAQSNVIQRAVESGVRTFSCQDKETNYLFSTPIKNPQGEIRIKM
ncbi:MAG TPA: hypothetical protein VFS76_23025 [Pyrinomonadaceae bacterium]|nr:hypothetical protein [Pyrinomonadaceae bacterium]